MNNRQRKIIYRIFKNLNKYFPSQISLYGEDANIVQQSFSDRFNTLTINYNILPLIRTTDISSSFKDAYIFTLNNLLTAFSLFYNSSWDDDIQNFIWKHIQYYDDYRLFDIEKYITIPTIREELAAKLALIDLSDIDKTKYDKFHMIRQNIQHSEYLFSNISNIL